MTSGSDYSSVSRQRLAQALAFSDDSTPISLHSCTSWTLLQLLAITGLAAPWVWSFLKWTKKRRSQEHSTLNRRCRTNAQSEKIGAGLLAGARKAPTSSVYSYAARLRTVERTALLAAMLYSLWFLAWLFFPLFSPSSALLEVFQVYHPLPIHNRNQSLSSCDREILLLNHVFGFSYGHPFVGYYEPPKCDFDTVRMSLTVSSKGRQFDRLAHMYLGDIEVFRTSTAEPTRDGIVWTYVKDMSQYNSLWRRRQKIIFELGNLINDLYTGSFNVTVTAHFSHEKNVRTADVILPISAQNSARNSSSAFIVPSQEAKVSYNFESPASRAVVAISACGQATEEFWWSNVFSSDTDVFKDVPGELYGYSPFREIQLHIDGALAGVVWPFPVIFTGGVSPGFWRPIVGTDAFDLRAPEIDISPFLPLLTDGAYHSFEIKVVGLHISSDGLATLSDTVGSNWVVSGNIFLYLPHVADPYISRMSVGGRGPEITAPTPTFSTRRGLLKSPSGVNESLAYSVLAERSFTVKSGAHIWKQELSFFNVGLFSQQGLSQRTVQQTTGTALFGRLVNETATDEVSFKYPLFVNTTYGNITGGLSIDAWMGRGLEINSTGMPGVSTYTLTSGPSHLRTEQRGRSSYRSTPGNTNSTSFGDTIDNFESYAGGEAYYRSVRAVNGSVIADTDRKGLDT